MKKCAVISVFLVVFFGYIQYSFADEQSWNWALSVDFQSQYIGGLAGSTIVSKPVAQPSLTVDYDSYFANAWLSLHADDPFFVREGDQLNLSLGKNWSLLGIKNTTSVIYFDLFPLNTLQGDLFAINDVMRFPVILTWSSALTVEWEMPKDEEVLEGGLLYKAEIFRDFFLGEVKITGNFSFGGHDGAYGLESEVISFVRGTISSPRTTENFVISPTLMLQWGGKKDGLTDDQICFGINFSF